MARRSKRSLRSKAPATTAYVLLLARHFADATTGGKPNWVSVLVRAVKGLPKLVVTGNATPIPRQRECSHSRQVITKNAYHCVKEGYLIGCPDELSSVLYPKLTYCYSCLKVLA